MIKLLLQFFPNLFGFNIAPALAAGLAQGLGSGGAAGAASPSAGAIAGQIGSALTGLLGQVTSQQQSARRRTEFRPEDAAALQAQQQALIGGGQRFQDLLSQLQGRAAAQPLPQFGTNIPLTQLSVAPDALARAQAAQGTQDILQRASAQQRQIASSFRGQPGVARALQAQAGIRAATQANPLLFQAIQAQQQRQLSQGQQQLAERQAQDIARARQFEAGRAQRAEELGLGGAGLQAQQNLLAALSALAGQRGEQVSEAESRQRAGGLLGALGIL